MEVGYFLCPGSYDFSWLSYCHWICYLVITLALCYLVFLKSVNSYYLSWLPYNPWICYLINTLAYNTSVMYIQQVIESDHTCIKNYVLCVMRELTVHVLTALPPAVGSAGWGPWPHTGLLGRCAVGLTAWYTHNTDISHVHRDMHWSSGFLNQNTNNKRFIVIELIILFISIYKYYTEHFSSHRGSIMLCM